MDETVVVTQESNTTNKRRGRPKHVAPAVVAAVVETPVEPVVVEVVPVPTEPPARVLTLRTLAEIEAGKRLLAGRR